MSSGSNNLTTYYAKRIIGDTAAANASSALLQTGTGIDTNTWILNRTNRVSTYGIKYIYDSSTSTVEEEGQEPATVNNGHDKIEFHGGGANASAWIQLDTGDVYILGNLGVGTVPSSSSFKLSVNGSAYFADHIYIEKNHKAKAIIFQQYESNARIGIIKYDSGDAENVTSGQFTFAEYSPKSTPDTSSTGYRENYTLPVCTAGLSANATYNILNTKENASPAIGTANYIAYYSATGTISDGKSSTSMIMPAHYYHNLYNNNPTTGTTVYIHYYNGDTTSTNTFANLRVKSGSSYKVLAFGGDGTFTWSGTSVVTNSGTWDISITGNAATVSRATFGDSGNATHDANSMTSNGLYYYTSNGPATTLGASTTDGAMYVQAYNTSWVAQIAQDYRNGGLYVRGKNNGTWQSWLGIPKMTVESYPALLPPTGANNWIKIGTSNTSYGLLPSQSGGAGSGHNYLGTSSWYWKYAYIDEIYGHLNGSCTGNAATASAVAWTGITGKPTQWDASTAATLSGGLPTPRSTGHAYLCGNGLFISGPYTSNDCGWIRATSTSESDFKLEIATGDDGGAGEEIVCRQYNTSNAVAHVIKLMDVGGNTLVNNLYVIGATTNSMGTSTTAPRIVFGEGSINNTSNGCSYIQGVALAYTDWDSYRASKGLKVLDYDGNDGGNVWFEAQGHIYAAAVHNAVWNDYAECRKADCEEPGYVISPDNNGVAHKTAERLMPGCRIISDTWGHIIGESTEAKTPIAVSGRVLAYPYRAKTEYHVGDCVCSAPDGKVDIMTREEIKEWPDRIIGIVNEIPDYDVWEQTEPDGARRTTRVEVKGRIWIDVR